MERLAIIGSGISGTSAAYYLQDRYEIDIFEKSDRVGGHANTLDVVEGDKIISFDTAFVVCNRPNYPNLFKFFEDLDVPTQKHLGGFNFYNLDSKLQFNSDDFNLSSEEVEAKFGPDFSEIHCESDRFFSQSRKDFWAGKTRVSLKEYLDENQYSQAFRDNFVVLMGSAVWSIPAESLMDFPASTFISFFMTHDKGGLGGRSVEWETVTGGSTRYVERVKSRLKRPIRIQEAVLSLTRDENGVVVETEKCTERYDKAIIATHADQALSLLAQPTELEESILGRFRYHTTNVTVHTDPVILNGDKTKWQSWNYGQVRQAGKLHTFVTYYANKVHNFEAEKDYFVSLDTPPLAIDPQKVIETIPYRHPEYDMGTIEAQKQIHRLNETGPIYFSGTYFHVKNRGIDSYGFHESGISSALAAVEKLS